ncbi:MAG: family 43 glycosylhydrolase [Bacteroidales bacterium]|nr:family 43 glycosylhydrolase [Bacteroidales bacterium]
MKNHFKLLAVCAVFAFCACSNLPAPKSTFTFTANPLVPNYFTSDPAPMVVGNTLYLYTGHDECYEDRPGYEGKYGYNLTNWLAFSTKDMIHWNDYGVVLTPTDLAYGEGEAWAAQMLHYKGKYYYFVSMQAGEPYGTKVISVGVGDSPVGPFTDHIGAPLVSDDMTDNGPRGWWNDIDPTVLVDTDGSVWMSWGNGSCFLAKLTEDLKAIDGEIITLNVPQYIEGPWLAKRGDLYYLVYAGFGGRPQPGQGFGEVLNYAVAKSITGPWEFRGQLRGTSENSFTTHPAIVEFKGEWYLFTHDGTQVIDGVKGSGGRRSVIIERLEFDADGNMKPLPFFEK